MKVYRGPSSKHFSDDTHELVSRVQPQELEDGIRSNALIRFNITKDGTERQAVCTAQFEDADVIPMISGLLGRLSGQQECLVTLKAAMADKTMTPEQKLVAVRKALSST